MTQGKDGLTRRELLAGAAVLTAGCTARPASEPEFDLLLQGGHLIDPKNGLSAVRDLAVHEGRVAAVEEAVDPGRAFKVVDCGGLYVTPGLFDMHVHAFAGTNEPGSLVGDSSLYPDGHTFRSGVTTVLDAGCAGWRDFETFRETVISRARTRVLALVNIVGRGMRGGEIEQDRSDMEAAPTAALARDHADVVVGIKTAHYTAPDWFAVNESLRAGEAAGLPLMVDFGDDHPERPLEALLGEKLRRGDIYTHCYAGNRRELLADGTPNPGLFAGRERGVLFDVGHGGRCFRWSVAARCLEAGFPPDAISTDLHIGSMELRDARSDHDHEQVPDARGAPGGRDRTIHLEAGPRRRTRGHRTPVGRARPRTSRCSRRKPATSVTWTASARARTDPKDWWRK